MKEEKTLDGKDVIKLLLGNKWLYLIMASVFLIVSLVGFNLYSAGKRTFVAFFDYNVAGFNTVTTENNEEVTYYIDGEKFDPRTLITAEKLNKYILAHDELKSLDSNNLEDKDFVKSFDYKVRYKENDHKMDDNDSAFVQDKKGYELVLNSSEVSLLQAKVLSKAIANEVLVETKSKIDSLSYSSYVNSFDSSRSYPEKISSLVSGVNYIFDLSNDLKKSYGDVAINSGKYGGEDEIFYLEKTSISAWREKMSLQFNSYFIDSLTEELAVNGYISPDYVDYIASLKSNVENLSREINVNEAVLADLKAQRDALVASVGSYATIESVEIREYNTEIISLTKLIADQKEQVDLYQLQLEKLDTSSLTPEQLNTYNQNLINFEAKLTNIFNELKFYTKQYEAIAKKVMKDNLNVYFDTTDIVTIEGEMNKYLIVFASFGIAIFLPMFINLLISAFNCAEGKSLIKKSSSERTKDSD